MIKLSNFLGMFTLSTIVLLCGFTDKGNSSDTQIEVLMTKEEALNFIFPNGMDIKEENHDFTPEEWKELENRLKKEYDVRLDKKYDQAFSFFIGYTVSGEVSHYGYIDVVQGKWGPITYIIGINLDGKIKDLAVISYKEKRGRPVKKRNFLDQFIGKSLADRLKVKRGIKAVSGATISSRGMAKGVKKVLALVDLFYLNKNES